MAMQVAVGKGCNMYPSQCQIRIIADNGCLRGNDPIGEAKPYVDKATR